MKRFNQVLMAASLGVLVAGVPSVRASALEPQASSSTAPKMDDDALESKIGDVLKKDAMLAPRNIDVESKGGHVTLTGTVRTATEKSRAARLAKVSGVLDVTNQIEIDPNADKSKIDRATEATKSGLTKAVDATGKAAEKTKEATQKGLGKSEEGVGKAADKTADAVGKAGDKVTDGSVTAKVKTSFSNDPVLKESAIDVDTTDHVVTLKGTVPSDAAKTKAGTLAKAVDGVVRVDNQIVVLAK